MLTSTICCSLQVLLQAHCSPVDVVFFFSPKIIKCLFKRLYLVIAESGKLLHGFTRNWLGYIFLSMTWGGPKETSTKSKMCIFIQK